MLQYKAMSLKQVIKKKNIERNLRQLSSEPRQTTGFTVNIIIMNKFAHGENDQHTKSYVENSHHVNGIISRMYTNTAKINIRNFFPCIHPLGWSTAYIPHITDKYYVLGQKRLGNTI